MSIPFNAITTGTFTSNGTSQLVTIPSDVVKFELYDITYFGSTAATTTEEISWWISSLPDAYAYIGNKTNAAATIAITSMATSGGFTLINPSSSSVLGSAIGPATAISNASPPVFSVAETGTLATGDTVRLTQSTGVLQLAGVDYTIGSLINDTSFSLLYGGTAPGSAGTSGYVQKVNINSPYYPRARVITAITAASSAVITLSVTHGFTAGQMVRIYVPSGWGMTQMNGQAAMVTAVNTTTNTITVNINSAAYTAFAYPSSATAGAGITFPQVVPIGENAINSSTYPYGNLLDDATDNQSAVQMFCGSSVVGASNDVMQWIAYRGLSI